MRPGEEQKSLAKFPLPKSVDFVDWDKMLTMGMPSRIAYLDQKIADFKNLIGIYEDLRAEYLNVAAENNLLEDDDHMLVRKERNLPRTINLKLFKEKFPEDFELAEEFERTKIREKIAGLKKELAAPVEKIHIETAQKILKDDVIDTICYPHKVVTNFEVIERSRKESS